MRSTTTITIALAAALGATACKKDEGSGDKGKPTTTTTSTTTTTTTSPPTANRPSQGKLPTMPELQLPEDAQRAQKVELGHALVRVRGHVEREALVGVLKALGGRG